jgi:hypothetical protein
MHQSRTVKKPLATEHALQCALIEYLSVRVRKDREVYWFAIPNAGKRTLAGGARMKVEGLTAGVADLCFMLPDGKCAWLELKRSRKQKQSREQLYFQDICAVLEHPYAVAHTFDEAVETLRGWGILQPSRSHAY